MKLKIIAVIVLCLFSNKIISQENENVDPKGKWFFGAEIGTNVINSIPTGEKKLSFQAGLLAEYYFARHWSFSSRIKYFETGVSFYSPGTVGYLGPHDLRYGTFKGAVITIPLDIKWEFRVYKNLGASLKFGLAPSTETQSEYSNYSNNQRTDLSKQYIAYNFGIGLNYFINKKLAVYVDFEDFTGQDKGHWEDGFLFSEYHHTKNTLLNFGIKYSFKEDKETK